MNKGVIAFPFGGDFIGDIARLILADDENGTPPGETAVVFGGKRPELFLKRELGRRYGRAFLPPACFTMDAFVRRVVSGTKPVHLIADLDAAAIIREIATAEGVLTREGDSFARFLPWGREIAAFLDHLDLEEITDLTIGNLEALAQLGFSVPPAVNTLLAALTRVRTAFRSRLDREELFTRGTLFREAARLAGPDACPEFRRIYFCGFFYLHRTERILLERFLAAERATAVFEGSQDEWPVLRDIATALDCDIRPATTAPGPQPAIIMTALPDGQAEAAATRDLLAGLARDATTVIVLPEPERVVPLLSEIAPLAGDCNVSLGYPLRRSAVFSLLEAVFRAQQTRRDNRYNTRDYLKVLTHPLAKNLRIAADPAATRILVHTIENFLAGETRAENRLAGVRFLSTDDIRRCATLIPEADALCSASGIVLPRGEMERLSGELHRLLFQSWEDPATPGYLCDPLEAFLDRMLSQETMEIFPLNIAAVERLQELRDGIASSRIAGMPMDPDDIFRIVLDLAKELVIPFSGSPLKGLQVLGMLETRSLRFDTVIVMDVNESSLPSLTVTQPLVPRQIMISLGLNRLEKEEEIQRYQFMRLITGARNVHLLYQENEKKERSRFVERLVWEQERSVGRIGSSRPVRRHHRFEPSDRTVWTPTKTPETLRFLSGFVWSASSLDAYLVCPFRFYHRYVLGLKERHNLLDDPDASHIGTFVHGFLERLFSGFADRPPDLGGDAVNRALIELDAYFEQGFSGRLGDEAFLVHAAVRNNLKNFLERERGRLAREPVRRIRGLERRCEDIVLELPSGTPLHCHARIDRIDEREDGSLLVLDYKTGSGEPQKPSARSLERMIADRQPVRKAVRSFQLPLYAAIAGKILPDCRVNAAFLKIADRDGKPLLLAETPEEAEEIVKAVFRGLDTMIREVLDPATGFQPEPDEAACRICPYGTFCG